jgi:hypothetical protein
MHSRSNVPMPDVPLRPIAGWEGLYAVAADGRVWSIPRTVIDVLGRARHVHGGWMSPSRDSKGYAMVSLRREGSRKIARVHRLVAGAWLPPAGPGQDQVNHKDHNRMNPAVTNLEWCTGTENQLHGWIGRQASPAHRAAAARCGSSRRLLNDAQVTAIRERIFSGETKASLAREYSASEWTIRSIGNGTRYIKPMAIATTAQLAQEITP